MALWGNNDNKFSGGTVSLNYGNKTVTGTGTTFGQTGAAAVGDVIRFGAAFGGATGFFGDAVITSIASTISCRIDSTAGLSGGEITDVQFQISECPKYAVKDSANNQSTGHVTTGLDPKINSRVATRTAIGGTTITITGNASGNNVTAGDSILFGTPHRAQAGTVHSVVGLSTIVLTKAAVTTTLRYHTPNNAPTAGIGTTLLLVTERAYGDDPDIDPVSLILAGDSIGVGTYSGTITTVNENFIGQRQLTLGSALTHETPAGAVVDVTRAAAPGDIAEVYGTEVLMGRESQVVGLSAANQNNAANTSYHLTSVGWVGITTYQDADGNDRVKTETLVAMSGITTGNTAPYPPA